jgi:hypothetical protein
MAQLSAQRKGAALLSNFMVALRLQSSCLVNSSTRNTLKEGNKRMMTKKIPTNIDTQVLGS